MRAVTISSLRNRIKYFFNLVVESSEVIIVPQTNKDDGVVLMSLKEYNALTETNYLLASEANRNRLLESIQQLDKEKLIPYDPDTDQKT